MRLYVDRGETEEEVERREEEKQAAVARVVSQPHAHRRNAHVRRREGGCGAFARCLSLLDEVVEETVYVARRGQTFLMRVEVGADGREEAVRDTSRPSCSGSVSRA